MQKEQTKKPSVSQPKDLNDVSELVGQIAQISLEVEQIEATANSRIQEIKTQAAASIKPLEKQISGLFRAIEKFASARRIELTDHGKTGTVFFANGRIVWRKTPPAVQVDCSEKLAIGILQSLGLNQFIRNLPELDREEVLAHPDALVGIDFIHITQSEIFEVIPDKVEISTGLQKKLRRSHRVK